MTNPWELPEMADHLDAMFASHGGVEGKAVLDIGCGAGWLVRRLGEQGANATGVECGAEMRRRAIEADPGRSQRYLDAGGEDLPFDDDSFDAAVFSFSLHHIPESDMAEALIEAARVVRSGGQVHVVEPVAQGLGHDVDALIDDETEVRAFAQAAVDATLSTTFIETASDELSMGTSYNDVDDYQHQLVGIDPGRAAVFGEKQAAVETLFYANAVEHDGRWWFEDHLLIRSFTLG